MTESMARTLPEGGADEGRRREASGHRPPPVDLDLTMSQLQSQSPTLLRSAVRTPTPPEGQGSRRLKVSKVWSTHMPREVKVEFKNIRSTTYDHSLIVERHASPETHLQVQACTATLLPPGPFKPGAAGIGAVVGLLSAEAPPRQTRPGLAEPRASSFWSSSGGRRRGAYACGYSRRMHVVTAS